MNNMRIIEIPASMRESSGRKNAVRKLRVAAYCRVSTEKEDQLHSLAAQQAYFEGTSPGTAGAARAFSPTRACQAPPSAGPDSPSCSGWPGRGRWI